MKRFNFKKQFQGLNKSQLEVALSNNKERLLKYIDNQELVSEYVRKISYIESLLNK